MSNLKKYKINGILEMSVTLLFLVGLIFIYGGMEQKIQNQSIFHFIYFCVLSVGIYLIAIRVLKDEYIYTYQDKTVPIRGFNFFKYLVFDDYKQSLVKVLNTIAIIFGLLALLVLDTLGVDADYNFHRIKLIIVALIFAVTMLPIYANDEGKEDQLNVATKETSSASTVVAVAPNSVSEARNLMSASTNRITQLSLDLKSNNRYSSSQFTSEKQIDLTTATEGDFKFAEAVAEFAAVGIIQYPTNDCLSGIIEDIESRDGKDVLKELLSASQFVRQFEGYKPDVLNTEFHFLALSLCAPEYKLEGVWEENSETQNATLHWIIDDKYFSDKTSEEKQQVVSDELQINLANSALEKLKVKSSVIMGESEDFTSFWYFDASILCPLFDKYGLEHQ